VVLSFLYRYYEGIQVNGVVHGVKWMSVGNDGMVKMVSLYHTLYILTFCLVSLKEDERTKFLILPTL